MTRITPVLSLIVFCCCAASAFAPKSHDIYKVTLVQAAPGKLPELIDLYKQRAAALQQAGDEVPLWMRHSQGDHWDLMILYPMGSYTEYYGAERTNRRAQAEQATADKFR